MRRYIIYSILIIFISCGSDKSPNEKGELNFKRKCIILPKTVCLYDVIIIGWKNKIGEQFEKVCFIDSLNFKEPNTVFFDDIKINDSINFTSLIKNNSFILLNVINNTCEYNMYQSFMTDTIHSQIVKFDYLRTK